MPAISRSVIYCIWLQMHIHEGVWNGTTMPSQSYLNLNMFELRPYSTIVVYERFLTLIIMRPYWITCWKNCPMRTSSTTHELYVIVNDCVHNASSPPTAFAGTSTSTCITGHVNQSSWDWTSMPEIFKFKYLWLWHVIHHVCSRAFKLDTLSRWKSIK